MNPALPSWGKNLALLAAFAPLHWLSLLPANVIWHPPAGVRFAWLLLLPARWWLPLALWLEIFYRLIDRWGSSSGRGVIPFFAYFIGTSLGAWLLRKRGIRTLEDTIAMSWLLGGMLLSSLGNALQITVWRPDWAQTMDAGPLFAQLVLGDFIGMLLVVPLILMVLRLRPQTEHWRVWRIDLPLVLLPLLMVLAAMLLIIRPGGNSYLFAAGLALPPAIYMAFRSGWRGVSLLLSTTSLLIGLVAWRRQNIPATLEGQLFLAMAGSTLLLLGAAAEALRERQRELRQRNRQLQTFARDLREAAQRNMRLTEDVCRQITSNLHDDIGQNLTALQIQLKLAERRIGDTAAFAPALELVVDMRDKVSGLMGELRPAGLDEFGLVRSLQDGRIRGFVESAGLDFAVHVEDEARVLDQLDNDVQTTLYRIAKEAATNTVKHAQATRFVVRLRANQSRGGQRVLLAIDDDGNGLLPSPGKGGVGLQGLRDRVLSLGGRLRITGGNGYHLLAVFRFPGGANERLEEF